MGVKAKKSYGQHFLTDEQKAERIAQSLSLEGYDVLFEIGPGTGMLSKYLLPLDIDTYFIDADRDMIQYMQQHYPDHTHRFILSDVLKFNFNKIAEDKPFAIVGNFPYNISSQIIFKAIDYRIQIPELVGMFQLEMAQRVCASHGSKIYGIISVLTQVFYNAELLFRVPPGSFNPPPKVHSAVIKLTRKNIDNTSFNYSLLKRIVKQSFNQRRKMMRNTLKGVFDDELLKAESIFTKRPEQLSVEEFIELSMNYSDQSL